MRIETSRSFSLEFLKSALRDTHEMSCNQARKRPGRKRWFDVRKENMEGTAISWTHNTFNGWIGCSKVSAGCAHCYAEGMNTRFGHANWGPGAPRRITSEANWRKPLKWNREAEETGTRVKVFCSSMADVFDTEAPNNVRQRLFELIKMTPRLDWQLLTKRPENFAALLPHDWGQGYENVWLGTTVENQQEGARRIPLLTATPARIRFLSCEPLLGDLGELDLKGIHWVIVGGESGRSARPFDIGWATNILEQCKAQGIPAFVKQLGGRPVFKGQRLRIVTEGGRKDDHSNDPAFWPAEVQDLTVREFPH